MYEVAVMPVGETWVAVARDQKGEIAPLTANTTHEIAARVAGDFRRRYPLQMAEAYRRERPEMENAIKVLPLGVSLTGITITALLDVVLGESIEQIDIDVLTFRGLIVRKGDEGGYCLSPAGHEQLMSTFADRLWGRMGGLSEAHQEAVRRAMLAEGLEYNLWADVAIELDSKLTEAKTPADTERAKSPVDMPAYRVVNLAYGMLAANPSLTGADLAIGLAELIYGDSTERATERVAEAVEEIRANQE